MYVKYSPLQSKQMLQQQYIDTQNEYLLVCLPEHMCCLQIKESLKQQLHQAFDVITLSQLSERLTEHVAGAVVFTEDIQCLSVALMELAAGLVDGADFVTANCSFGPWGQTEYYQSAAESPVGCHCAAISRALLIRTMQQSGQLSAEQLIDTAANLASVRKHLSKSLFLSRREIQVDDIYRQGAKKALILNHEFSMTGAPIVLVNMIPVLRSLGFETVVLGPADGPALELFIKAGARVITNLELLSNLALYGVALNCDLVVVNTVCQLDAIHRLNGAHVPVLWWLHDAFQIYPYIEANIPHQVQSNVKICAVGAHATAAMHSTRPDFEIAQLVYGLPDYAKDSFPPYDLSYVQGKQLFVTVGSMEVRKGQDILCRAIRMLPQEKIKNCAFLFVGKSLDDAVYATVLELVDDYPESVFYRKSLTRDEIKSLMQQCACVICSSRDDPMPTFVTEGLIFGRPAIVSEHTGTAGLIQEGVDGFVYHGDSAEQLAEKIEYFMDHPDLTRQMSAACRSLYERCFTQESFAATVKQVLEAAEEVDS